MKKNILSLLGLLQLVFLLVSCEVPSEIDNKTILNKNPTGQITYPANGAVVNSGAAVIIKADASDIDGRVAKVEFFLDINTKIGEDITYPYEIPYSGFDESVAEHKLNVAITDVDGGYFVNLTPSIVKINKKPLCEITYPTTNSFFHYDELTYLDVLAFAKDKETGNSIDSVTFKINSKILKVNNIVSRDSVFSARFSKNDITSGKNLIVFKAYDNFGAVKIDSMLINVIGAIKFYDGFESYTDFNYSSALGANWTQKDIDKGSTYVISGTVFPNQGYKGSFIIFNPNLAIDTSASPDVPMANVSHDGNKFAACFSNSGNGSTGNSTPIANNDWLITKKIVAIDSTTKVSFWARSYNIDYGMEKFGVYVSSNTNNIVTGNETVTTNGVFVGDFKKISGTQYIWEQPPNEWTNYVYDLKQFAGKDIYITVACKSFDIFFLMLDDFMVFNYDGSVDDYKSSIVKPPYRDNRSIVTKKYKKH